MKSQRGGRRRGGGGGGQRDTLRQLKESVGKFVKTQGGCGDAPALKHQQQQQKRSRREERREKRRMRKRKMKNMRSQHVKKGSDGAPTDSGTDARPPQPPDVPPPQPPDVPPAKERSVRFAPSPQPPVAPPPKQRRVRFAPPHRAGEAPPPRARRLALLEANSAEEREIKRLEKLLGLHRRRKKQSLPQAFITDGLDYILDVLEPGAAGRDEEEEGAGTSKELREEDEEPGSEGEQEEKEEEEEDEGSSEEQELEDEEDREVEDEEDKEPGAEQDVGEEVEMEEEDVAEASDDDCVEGDDEEAECSERKDTDTAGGKYVPPHLRQATDTQRRAELERLKRNLKGLINRLSEPNMASISGQLEQMYMTCSRNDMNETLTEVLLSACVTPALMPDRLLMEHVLLLSVLHHTVGLEVGAHFLERVVRLFDEAHRRDDDEGKECDNLLSIIAHLYNFHVVHCLLLFDLLKRLLSSFKLRDIQLILLLLRNVGFALRKDDPLALKELISEAQCRASAEDQRLQEQSRVRFMLETMMALKNNDMRKIPGYDPEPVERLRKLQRTLVHHRASGTDLKLRVSLENLLDAERVGRWWIVGSSWSGAPMIGARGNKTQQAPPPGEGEQFSVKVLELARTQRMNTDVRRNIFCIIMTSEDYLDAFEKLLRLGLKGQQEREIIYVLLHCCLQEKTFNSFYTVLTEKFCSHDRRFQMTVQFCLWDKFKELSTLSGSSFSNLVQLVTQLLLKNSLSLSILKAIEFGELDKVKVKFLKQILSKLLQSQTDDVVQIFSRISGIPKLSMLREGLKLFVRHFLLRSDRPEGTSESSELLRDRAEIAIKAMEARDAKLKL